MTFAADDTQRPLASVEGLVLACGETSSASVCGYGRQPARDRATRLQGSSGAVSPRRSPRQTPCATCAALYGGHWRAAARIGTARAPGKTSLFFVESRAKARWSRATRLVGPTWRSSSPQLGRRQATERGRGNSATGQAHGDRLHPTMELNRCRRPSTRLFRSTAWSVSSFLQRAARTDAVRNTFELQFFCLSPESLRRRMRSYVGTDRMDGRRETKLRHAMPLLAHQVMGSPQAGGISGTRLCLGRGRISVSSIRPERLQELSTEARARNLYETDGLTLVGQPRREVIRRKTFFELNLSLPRLQSCAAAARRTRLHTKPCSSLCTIY